jgi:hypothetical protein
VGLYGILVGLALFGPIEALATDILDHPVDGDWSLRALATGLVIEAAVWFHALSAEMGLAELADKDAPRHDSLPGVTRFGNYWQSLADFWLGAVVVVLLVVMAAAVQRGAAAFLMTFAVYAAADAIWEAVYLLRHRRHAKKAWEDARSPRNLLRQLRADRHLPATEEDARLVAESSTELEVAWARAAWYWLAVAIAFALGAAVLASTIGQSLALATVASIAWLVAVVIAVVVDYVLFPQFYAA